MEDIIKNSKKKERNKDEDMFEIDEKSDYPIHERYTKEEDIQQIKKDKRRKQLGIK